MPEQKTPDLPDIQKMFDRIAPRYDLINTLMTWGRDRHWRKYVIEKAALPKNGRLLDIGAGTGAIAREAVAMDPSLTVIAADFALDMMRVGRLQAAGDAVRWCGADALNLPFSDDCFDAVTSGYLIRNVSSAAAAFREQRRVLRPGGRVVCLDTSPPRQNVLFPLILCYFKIGIPFMGRLISGSRKAYRYLPESTRRFKTPAQLSATMESSGFTGVASRAFMFGTIAIHTGTAT